MKTNKTTREEFYAPILRALELSHHTRNCKTLSDENFFTAILDRTIDKASSGREFVQNLNLTSDIEISNSCFFDSIKSKRRQKLTDEVCNHVRDEVDKLIKQEDDPLSKYSELADFNVYAADGTEFKASAHETRAFNGKKYGVSHIFALNLRTHGATHICHLQPDISKKKKHEIKGLKELAPSKLRLNTPTGKKVIYAYDPAIVDYQQWYNWKQSKGIYIITREKENSALMTLGELYDFDRTDPRNTGVLSDDYVGPANGRHIRRIIYQDPVSGEIYRYITNEMTIPAGLIVLIYKLRWDIEKIFDEFKNKLEENKAWGDSEIAKYHQANSIALAHNLLLLLERKIKDETGISDEKAEKKREKRLLENIKKAEQENRKFNPLVAECSRITERSLQFIRWLRVALRQKTLWCNDMKTLSPYMEKYLC